MNNTNKKQIIDEIENSKNEQIDFLQKLIQTQSVNQNLNDPTKSSPYDPIELDVANLIFNKLKEIGLNPKYEGISPSRPNVVCELGKKGSKTIIFNGHMDTVPPAKDYDFNPFLGFITNGKLYGAGALDMKSALCCYVFLARALSKFEKELSGKICLQFVIDEEPMGASYFGTRYLLEKGYIGDAAIVGEPGAKKITIGNRGGYRFKVEVFGDAVHTGSKEWEKGKGVNATLEMVKAIEEIKKIAFPDKEHPIFPGRKSVLTFPTLINGGEAINIVPDYCVAFGDIRILPGITKEYIEEEIKNRLDKLNIKYKLTPIVFVPASFIDEKERLVEVLRKNIKQILNKDLIAEGSGPWSDMWMFIEKNIPAVNFGCDGIGMHDKNEYVEIQSVVDVTKIYALTAIDFLEKK